MAYRPVQLKIDNRTGYTLTQTSTHIECGKLESQPPQRVAAGTVSGAWEAVGSGLKGPKGSVTFMLAKGRKPDKDKDGREKGGGNGKGNAAESIHLTFSWNHPVGTAISAYTVTSSPEGEVVYQHLPPNPTGHEQHITYIPMLAHAYQPVERAHWMKALPDDAELSALTIPGTHDTCARLGGPAAECQTMGLRSQLNAGIRFIDIRCNDENDELRIYHGIVSQNLDFATGVRDVCEAFLRDNPSECIVMLVNQEDNGRGIAPRFWSELRGHEDHWYLQGTVPRLRDARGRIVLLRRFDNEGSPPPQGTGIDLTSWRDDATFSINGNGIHFRIQDQYKVATLFDIPKKWGHVASLLQESAPGPNGAWFINYTSGSGGAVPIDVARGTPDIEGVNSQLADFMFSTTQAFVGTVVMDFPELPNNCQMVDTLIAMNQAD